MAGSEAESAGTVPGGGGGPQRQGRVRQVPFEATTVELIGETLGVPVGLAPFRLPGAAVYQLLVPGGNDRPTAMLTLWPSLRRVDVRVGDSALVLKGVDDVLLFPGVEVMFRRHAPVASVFVSVGGRFGMSA